MASTGDRSGPYHQATSLSLLVRVQNNQAGAWERLIDLYAPLVYHWCHRAQLSQEDSADVFQEVFRAVAQNITRFHRDRPGDSFRSWLKTIARTRICDLVRRLHDQPQAVGGTDAQLQLQELTEPLPDDDPSEDNLLRQQVRQVLESIRCEFEDRTWQAFWQVQMDGHSPGDVAAELGMTAPAVRKAKLRVLNRLRDELGGLLQ